MKVCCVVCQDGVCRPRVCDLIFIGDESHLVVAWEARSDGSRVPAFTVQIALPDLIHSTQPDAGSQLMYPQMIRTPGHAARLAHLRC